MNSSSQSMWRDLFISRDSAFMVLRELPDIFICKSISHGFVCIVVVLILDNTVGKKYYPVVTLLQRMK
jgi:hypothetical protein